MTMKKSDHPAHPYLRLVYSRPEPDPVSANLAIIQDAEPTWPPISAGVGTIERLFADIRQMCDVESDEEP